MIYGRFNCVTSRVKVLDELEKKEEDEQFWNANTLIGTAILKSGHPTYGLRYREPIIHVHLLCM